MTAPPSPGSLPIQAPRDRADTGTVPHSSVPLWLWLAALCPGPCSPPAATAPLQSTALKEDPEVEGNFVRDSEKSDNSPWGKPQCSAGKGQQGVPCFQTLHAGEPHGQTFLSALQAGETQLC